MRTVQKHIEMLPFKKRLLRMHGWVPDPGVRYADHWVHPSSIHLLSGPRKWTEWTTDEACAIQIVNDAAKILEQNGWEICSAFGNPGYFLPTQFCMVGKLSGKKRMHLDPLRALFRLQTEVGPIRSTNTELEYFTHAGVRYAWCPFCAGWHSHEGAYGSAYESGIHRICGSETYLLKPSHCEAHGGEWGHGYLTDVKDSRRAETAQ